MEEIKDSVAQMQRLFMQQMGDFQAELHKSSIPATTSTLAADFASFRTFVIAALQSLQKQLEVVTRSHDNMEMQSRRKILLFHGVHEMKSEDTSAIVVKTVIEKLKVADFSVSSISRCHRMGRAATPDKTRPILVKIRDYSLRNKVWSAKANLKATGVTLTEFLTKSRHDIFMTARRKFGIARTWTRDGTVFVLGHDGTRHRVTCRSELDNIVEPTVSKQAAAVKEVTVTGTKSKRTTAVSRK